MAIRTGSADLPLHGGRVPDWLAARMERLGRVVVEAIVLEYGRAELLRRLAHPFWFQSFGAVMGMDWHSSGITTSVLGALKRGLSPVALELGVYVCGGRGRHSRKTPAELARVGGTTGIDGAALARTSHLVAKVDSAAVQDGFDLYLHGFIVTADGAWTVVQQGMRTVDRTARRYHWLSEGLPSFVDEPHAAIDGEPQGPIVNLTDRRAARARAAQVELVRAGPQVVLRELGKIRAPQPTALALPHLVMPEHHDVRRQDVVGRRIAGALAAAHERAPVDFAELLSVPGIGARTVFALAQVAEVLHGAPSRFSDPARFSFAHGGKDGHPFPVPLRVYDQTLAVLRRAVDRAKLGNDDKLAALRRLDSASRRLEKDASRNYRFEDHIASERERSGEWGGRTASFERPSVRKRDSSRQEHARPGQLEFWEAAGVRAAKGQGASHRARSSSEIAMPIVASGSRMSRTTTSLATGVNPSGPGHPSERTSSAGNTLDAARIAPESLQNGANASSDE